MPTFDSDAGSGRKNPWTTLTLLADKQWLQSAFASIKAFIPILLPAQAMILGGEMLMTILSKLALGQMNPNSLTLPGMIGAFAFLLTGLVVGAPLLLVGFGRMIFRLTAFCRFWLTLKQQEQMQQQQMQPQELQPQELQPQELQLHGAEAIGNLSGRKRFLASYWFYGSLLLMVPISILLVALYIKLSTSGKPDIFIIHTSSDLSAMALLLICIIYILTVSALMFPVGAMEEKSPGKAALSTFAMSFKLLLPAIPVLALLAIVNTIIGSPDLVFRQLTNGSVLMPSENLLLNLLLLVWQAATGLIILPASMLPFCELWKTTKREPL